MKKLLTLILFSSALFAHSTTTQMRSSIESIDFKNSVQKYSGIVIGVGTTLLVDKSLFQATYEYTKTDTKQPPLSADLKVNKLYFKYSYTLNQNWNINLHYLNVLSDNIAPTAHGKSYALGITYNFTPKSSLNFTQYLSDYKDFDVYQSEVKFEQKIKIDNFKTDLSAISKFIHLDDYESNAFSKNAKEDYATYGFKVHSHYASYHLGLGAYFGKRAFAIMNDGFKMQHHAMEFDRTYAGGIGKTFNKLTLRVQYTYQRATELPLQNGKKVDIANSRVLLNYKF